MLRRLCDVQFHQQKHSFPMFNFWVCRNSWLRVPSCRQASDSLRSACKSIQEKLQCEAACESQRNEAELSRAKKVEEIKSAYTTEVNKKRENIEQGCKDKEAELVEKYKDDSTEGFV